MKNEDEKYGAIRVKNSTISEYRRLKLATEGSLGREITNDEFVRLLLEMAMKGKQ